VATSLEGELLPRRRRLPRPPRRSLPGDRAGPARAVASFLCL